MDDRLSFILSENRVGIGHVIRSNDVRWYCWRRDNFILALNKWIFEVIYSRFDDSSGHN